MGNRLILAVAAAFALSFVAVGTSSAAAVCDPHCSVKGLTQANSVAGDNGAQGRAHPMAKHGIVLVADNGGAATDTSGTTSGTDTSGTTSGTDTSGTTSGGDTTGGTTTTTTSGPCDGC